MKTGLYAAKAVKGLKHTKNQQLLLTFTSRCNHLRPVFLFEDETERCMVIIIMSIRKYRDYFNTGTKTMQYISDNT